MGERVTAVGETGDKPGEFPISPLLERSSLDDNGHLEISIAAVGQKSIDEGALDIFLRHARIAPGERIELGLFVAAGAVDAIELDIFYDHDELIDLANPGTVRRRSSGPETATGQSATDSLEATAERDEIIHTSVGEPIHALTRKPLGGTDAGGPGYILEINTQSTVTPGAYSLPIVFTYRSADGITQVKEQRTIHVKTRRQRWEPWVTRAVVALVVLAGVVTVLLLEPAVFF
ncbi:hypothetical protein G6M89_07375 [Natronolimnobius sp. AArcel1]|uniref:hypothetical protein n=1 Tax=Natronolimnobius sp. AArcel1 TaxID=1679093 RepID=UPI0013EB7B7A|nr:hypothetical protein [Natronolimnobius sp. AArcel1]NGM68831.1 hypothetical protein [Natronolimnobius sp. AArcel1]